MSGAFAGSPWEPTRNGFGQWIRPIKGVLPDNGNKTALSKSLKPPSGKLSGFTIVAHRSRRPGLYCGYDV